MPLPLPKLDNRTFEELIAEGQGLIPGLSPGWTDHNVHDPGITLTELFAWLTEASIYRLGRTPAASYRAFLKLLGVSLRPAQVAETVLYLRMSAGNAEIFLPAGVQIGDANSTLIFQTSRDIYVSPARLESIFTLRAGIRTDHIGENETAGKWYYPFGSQPEQGVALYLGFDRPLANAEVEVSLSMWTGSIIEDRTIRARLIAEWESDRDEKKANCPEHLISREDTWYEHYSARTVWEYYSNTLEWRPLANLMDETRGLTLSGPIRFTYPNDHGAGGVPDQKGPTHYYIRCRLTSGRYECPPEIEMIQLNTVACRHAADSVSEEHLGGSNGAAEQVFTVRRTPVVPGSTTVRVLLPGGEESIWREELSWDGIGPHDEVYQLIPENGELRFGNGRIGKVPPANAEIHVKYQVGGGAAGNVPARYLQQILDNAQNRALVSNWNTIRPVLRVVQPFAVIGGEEAETQSAAQGRAVQCLAQRHRAITLQDFEELALSSPGVPVARAHAMPDFHPDAPCFPASGCITVIVVPHCADPSRNINPGFLKAVSRYLERRRTVATEVHVTGPAYTTVIVHARLHVDNRSDKDRVRKNAQDTLAGFFHHLNGGPDKKGWPIGRDVYRAEIMALLNELPGVISVDELGLRTEKDSEPRCGNLPLCPNSLIISGEHQIQIIQRSTIS